MPDVFDQIHSQQPDVFDQIHSESGQQTQPSALSRFGTGLYQSTIGPLVDTGKTVAKDVLGGHFTDAAKDAVAPVVNTVSNLIGVDDLHQAFGEYKKGNYTNAALILGKNLQQGPAGRAADATVTPIVNDAQSGNVAGALGRVAGTAATLALPERGVPGTAATEDVLGNAIRNSAENNYIRVLAPGTPADKLRATQVVPELIDRGVTATTRHQLAERAASEAAAASQKLDAAYDALPEDASIPLKPVLDHLEEAKQKYTTSNAKGETIPLSRVYATAMNHLDELGNVLSDVAKPGPDGELVIPVKQARFFKGQYDDVAARAGRYTGSDLSTQSQGEAHGIAADAIRQGIAENFPTVEKANKEFKLWKDTQDIAENSNMRRVGEEPNNGAAQSAHVLAGLGGGAAGALGAAAGLHVAGMAGAAALTAGTLEALARISKTAAWRTVSSVAKDRLADAIQKGNPGAAQFYASKILQQVNAAQAAVPGGSSATSQPAAGATSPTQ